MEHRKLPLDSVLAMIGKFLRTQGMMQSADALQKECPWISDGSGLPALMQVIDEWSEFTQLSAVSSSSSSSSSTSQQSLRNLLNGDVVDSTEQALMTPSQHHSSAAVTLGCSFFRHSYAWGDARGLLSLSSLDGRVEQHGQLPNGEGGATALANMGTILMWGSAGGSVGTWDGLHVESSTLRHKKAVHRAVASASGDWGATASRDGVVRLWHRQEKQLQPWGKVVTVAIAEALCFANDTTLVIGVRDSPDLRIVRLNDTEVPGAEEELKTESINVNEFGDGHATFTPLDIAFCPRNEKLVAIASDRDRVFVYSMDLEALSCRLLTTLVGIRSDEMAQTRVQWSNGAKYLYASSSDGLLCIYDSTSGDLIERVKHHKAAIRDMAMHPSANMIVTTSFDKSCLLWTASQRNSE